jgi:hypothetical protein
MGIVIVVAHEFSFEVGHVLEFLEVKELGLEHGEEALDDRVVETVAFSGHTLGDPVLAQLRRKRAELVLSVLVNLVSLMSFWMVWLNISSKNGYFGLSDIVKVMISRFARSIIGER